MSQAATSPEYSAERIGIGAAGLALLASFFWGGNQVFIKIGLQGMPPLAMAGARFAIGLVVVVIAAVVAREPLRGGREEWLHLFGLAVLFLLQIILLNQGVNYTTASRASVTIAAHPFFLALFCHFFVPGDRLTLFKVIGSTLAFGGVIMVFAESVSFADTSFLVGDLLIFASAILLGLRQMVMKRMVRGLNPFQVLFWQSLLSLPMFVLLSIWLEHEAVYDLTPSVVGAVLYQGVVVAGLCFIIWIFLLRRHSASQLGVFAFTTPIAGVLLSAFLVGDELSWLLLASMALVAGGIAVAARSEEN